MPLLAKSVINDFSESDFQNGPELNIQIYKEDYSSRKSY